YDCPLGTFLCQNSTKCIKQAQWCDKTRDCPGGEDEDMCFDVHGNWRFFNKKRRAKTLSNLPAKPCQEIPENDPGNFKNCDYNVTECMLVCNKFSDKFELIPENLRILTIKQSSLKVWKSSYLAKVSSLRTLRLHDDKIKTMEFDAFAEQKSLRWLFLSGNEIEELTEGHLKGLKSIEWLDLSENKIHNLNMKDLENSETLLRVDLDSNLLTSSNISIPHLPALQELNLDENRLEAITKDMFSRLPSLFSLNLSRNLIQFIDSNAFKNLKNLEELNLEYNKIVAVSLQLFSPLRNLTVLKIGYNQLENFSPSFLIPFESNLESLGLQEVDLDNVEPRFFNRFQKLDFVYFKRFHYCTAYAPAVRKCTPAMDGVSSLTDLLSKPLLRSAVWCISVATFFGNALVLWGRFTSRDENSVLSIIIRNLAIADLFMGVYLLVIGYKDMTFRSNYGHEANAWVSSWFCTLLGMLAMTSSEVSVLILVFISVERFMLIASPLKGHRAINRQTAVTSMIIVWTIGFAFALFPVINWLSSTRFYGLNGMCFPLHIDDPYLAGWEYSAFIFLGVNLLGLVTIGYVYTGMFASIWRTRHATPLSVLDSEFALRFFLIVLTDAICWAPIIILKIMALAKYPVNPDLHSWVVIFILPVNSTVNPLLYTFTTPKFRERLSEGWFGKMRSIVSRKQSRS
ncbi:hypothetical protein QAD02_014538, partial [Eretmocerus hayati]